jgi:hypothetical protein
MTLAEGGEAFGQWEQGEELAHEEIKGGISGLCVEIEKENGGGSGVWCYVHVEEGRGAVSVRSAREGALGRQGRRRGGGQSGTCCVKQGNRGGGVSPMHRGEELGTWATAAMGSAQ